MCDTLCALGPSRALFAKNSDRPPGEVQLIESFPPRPPGGTLRTQYLEIEDTGAFAVLGSRPSWLWGFEHGVNEHRVAIGNEKVFTTSDPNKEPPALIGMDLVRLGLERARSASEALDVMTSLLERHGQGGVCDQTTGESYYSSFLIADPRSAWVLETSGGTWAASPVQDTAAISNRLTIRTEWTRASPDVPRGSDFDAQRHPAAPTGHADVRLSASRACLARGPDALSPSDLAAHLRDHGSGSWGRPDEPAAHIKPLPSGFSADGAGVTVCMHLRGFQNTTAAMIAELPSDRSQPLRAWVAPGNPCVSVFVPIFPPYAVPPALAEEPAWHMFAALRDLAETDDALLTKVRACLAPLEAELWQEADAVAPRPHRHASFVESARRRVAEAASGLTGAS